MSAAAPAAWAPSTTDLRNAPGGVVRGDALGVAAQVVVVLELVVAPGVRGVVLPVVGREAVAAGADDGRVHRCGLGAVVDPVDVGRDRVRGLGVRRVDLEGDVDLPRAPGLDGRPPVRGAPGVGSARIGRRYETGVRTEPCLPRRLRLRLPLPRPRGPRCLRSLRRSEATGDRDRRRRAGRRIAGAWSPPSQRPYRSERAQDYAPLDLPPLPLHHGVRAKSWSARPV